MFLFKEIKETKDFLALHGPRASALAALGKLKTALENLPKDKPSVIAFQRNEDKIDSRLEQLEVAADAVSNYFGTIGGDTINE